MEFLKISNKGELDIRLVELMGGTTKSNDQYKIGQFGTGLKYTLSWLIRNNILFHLFIGEKKIEIETKTEQIRNEDFQIVYINGNRTSLTTSMGKEWEAWMIIREVWCNALDEEDTGKEIVREVIGKEGYTTFYIQNTGDIKEVVENWEQYFLQEVEPLQDGKDFAIYSRATKGIRLYKNGVLIYKQEKGINSVFSYDIKTASINEMREYRGYMSSDIAKIVAGLDKKNATYFMDNIEGSCEEEFEYDSFWNKKFETSWKEAIGNAKLIDRESYDNLVSRGVIGSENAATFVVLPKSLFKTLSATFDGVSGVRTADKVNSFYELYDAASELKIKEGLAILESCDYRIEEGLVFEYGIFGDKNVIARINIDEKIIMISDRVLSMSLFDIVTTLIEENEHYRTGYTDCTREFQQHFIDMFTTILLKKNEVRI